MTCNDCQAAQAKRWHGGYDLACLPCCARLVLSARPSREHAGSMLAAIDRFLMAQSPALFSTREVSARAREMLPAIEQQERERRAAVRDTAMTTIRKALRHDTAGT